MTMYLQFTYCEVLCLWCVCVASNIIFWRPQYIYDIKLWLALLGWGTSIPGTPLVKPDQSEASGQAQYINIYIVVLYQQYKAILGFWDREFKNYVSFFLLIY